MKRNETLDQRHIVNHLNNHIHTYIPICLPTVSAMFSIHTLTNNSLRYSFLLTLTHNNPSYFNTSLLFLSLSLSPSLFLSLPFSPSYPLSLLSSLSRHPPSLFPIVPPSLPRLTFQGLFVDSNTLLSSKAHPDKHDG